MPTKVKMTKLKKLENGDGGEPWVAALDSEIRDVLAKNAVDQGESARTILRRLLGLPEAPRRKSAVQRTVDGTPRNKSQDGRRER